MTPADAREVAAGEAITDASLAKLRAMTVIAREYPGDYEDDGPSEFTTSAATVDALIAALDEARAERDRAVAVELAAVCHWLREEGSLNSDEAAAEIERGEHLRETIRGE